ncbi:hypothetical protein C5U48_02645 [Mycolicibacter virginiensis]|uniref:DUF732 domain-containing protein n=1 Tax=Mycolicibacter virginiensis TaxID=1795032 RepID=A0A9X7IQP3_9MYCO|nr:DUF732 domain-containing protein [Mycolicibacter virginiensis]PQM53727.1 hypothetical protein C5U48_02645 [Mycolicibacter virginiensis]
MKRIAKALSAGAAAAGLLLGTAGVAQADDASYLRYTDEHGITYYDNAPSSRLAVGRVICDNLRFGGDPRAGFNFVSNAMVSQPLIDAAQRELCPETLEGPK